jgi:hypothetical protein
MRGRFGDLNHSWEEFGRVAGSRIMGNNNNEKRLWDGQQRQSYSESKEGTRDLLKIFSRK